MYSLDTDLAAHVAAGNPHAPYQLKTEKDAANGYASLDSGLLVPKARLGSGTADATTFLRGDGVWTTSNTQTLVRKTADQADALGAILDDTHLFFSVAANSAYSFEMVIIGESPSGLLLKNIFSGPAGVKWSIRYWGEQGAAVAAGGYAYTYTGWTNEAGAIFSVPLGSTGQYLPILYKGVIINGATAGTFKWRWAIAAATTAIVIKANSHLRYQLLV